MLSIVMEKIVGSVYTQSGMSWPQQSCPASRCPGLQSSNVAACSGVACLRHQQRMTSCSGRTARCVHLGLQSSSDTVISGGRVRSHAGLGAEGPQLFTARTLKL